MRHARRRDILSHPQRAVRTARVLLFVELDLFIIGQFSRSRVRSVFGSRRDRFASHRQVIAKSCARFLMWLPTVMVIGAFPDAFGCSFRDTKCPRRCGSNERNASTNSMFVSSNSRNDQNARKRYRILFGISSFSFRLSLSFPENQYRFFSLNDVTRRQR